MPPHPSGRQAPSSVSAPPRGLRALEADLEVVASPLALWTRLLVAAVLASAFGGVGLIMTLSGSLELFDPADSRFGSSVGALAIGLIACAIAAVCIRAGRASFKAYRLRGLL